MAADLEGNGLNFSRFKEVAKTYSELLQSPLPADASRFLVRLKDLRNLNPVKKNSSLAEALMLFQDKLAERNPDPKHLRSAFLHYVINTASPLLADAEDDSVLKDLRKSYVNSILIAHNWNGPGQSVTNLTGLRDYGRAANMLRYGRPDMVPVGRIPFDESAAGYSDRNAVWMAEMSNLAYWVGKRYPGDEKSEVTRRLVERQLSKWGYGSTLIESAKTDTRVFLAEMGDHLILSFKGTSISSRQNIATDLDFTMTKPGWSPGRIHQGFANGLEDAWIQIANALARHRPHRKEIWVTGHSLGAALAQLAAYRLKHQLKYEIRAVYTYGTPRVGDEGFVNAYDQSLGERTFPHINADDVVPNVPPAWGSYGYRPAANGQTRKFMGKDHTTLTKFAQGRADWERQEDPNELRDQALNQIDHTTRYLKGTEGILSRANHYNAPTPMEGMLGSHGSYEYLFKLACVVTEEYFWKNETRRARD